MDLATLGLRVDSSGFVRAMGDVERSSDRATRSGRAAEAMANTLKTALAGLGLGLGLRELIQYADTWNLIEGRLSLVTSSSRNLSTVQNEVFEGAQRARVGFEATSSLYTKLARNADALGASQRDMLTVTETINKAFVVSGASAGETDSAVRQLGQAFASGALRGDELNSVLENAPRLAEAMAAGMNVSVGALRQMGREGKLTAKEVFDAIQSQAEVIEAEFGRMPVTVGQSMTVLRNEVLRFVGAGDNATGMSRALADVVILASKNLRGLVTVITAAGAAYVIYSNAAKIAAFWTAAVAAAQTIAAYVSLALQIRSAAAATALLSMASKGLVAFLTGPAGIAIALGLVVGWLISYKTRTDEARMSTDDFRSAISSLSREEIDLAQQRTERALFEAEEKLARIPATVQFQRYDARGNTPIGPVIEQENRAYRAQAAEVDRLSAELRELEERRTALAELEVRPTATGGVAAAPSTQQQDMVRLAQQAARLAQLEGDAQARLAIEYEATNKAIEARRELASRPDLLSQTLGAIDAEKQANLSALSRDARRTNEDARREAEQQARLAEVTGAAQEALAVEFRAVNREIEVRRNLTGRAGAALLGETLAAIQAEREYAMAALSSNAALEERANNDDRIAAARRELELARQQGSTIRTTLAGNLVVERSNAAERVRINEAADEAIAAARKRLAGFLSALLPSAEAAIEAERQLKLETLGVAEAMEREGERLQQVASVLEDFRGRVAGTFEGLFEGVLSNGLEGFKAFFGNVRQMLNRMVAEMLTRQVMTRIGNSVAGSLAGAFGNMPGASTVSPTATTMATAGSTMMQAATTMQAAASTLATGAVPPSVSAQPIPVTMEGISVQARESWVASLARVIGPAIAGYAAGSAVGGQTNNRLMGAASGYFAGAWSGAAAGAAFGPVGMAIGAGIGSLVGAISGFNAASKRREEADKRAAELVEQNNAALQALRNSMDAQLMSGGRLDVAGEMTARLVAALQSGQVSANAVGRAFNFDVDNPLLQQMERTFGVSFQQLAAIARETGIQLYDSAGKLVPAALEQLAQAIGYTVERITQIGSSVDDRALRQQAYNAIFGVQETAQQKLNDTYALLRESAPDLLRSLGLDSLDLSSQAGRDALMEGFQEIFRLLDSGSLTAEMLGSFGDWRELMAAILGNVEALNAFKASLDTVTTDFPRAMDVLLYEQKFGRGPGTASAPTSPATAPPAGSSSTSAATASGSQRVVVVNGGMHVTVNPAYGESGESILRRIEEAVEDREGRGGYTPLGSGGWAS